MMRRSRPGVLVALAVLLSACGGGPGAGEAARTTPLTRTSAATTTPMPESSAESAAATVAREPLSSAAEPGPTPNDETMNCSDVVSGWNTDPESALGYAQAEVVDVRTGTHECYQRIVFDVNEPVEVGYQVGYVPVLRQEGSGRALDVAGSATLRVSILAPATTIARSGTELLATGRLPAGPVRAIRFAGTFEGVSSFGIGLRGKRPFAVSTWQEGSVTHVIVDVATS